MKKKWGKKEFFEPENFIFNNHFFVVKSELKTDRILPRLKNLILGKLK